MYENKNKTTYPYDRRSDDLVRFGNVVCTG
jgi:hypothetical protein